MTMHRIWIASLCFGVHVCIHVHVVHSLECATGYGQKVRVIPDDWINDGFCDCPLDALDEPETEACSGAPVGGWPGIGTDIGTDRMESSPTFQCPQQKKKKLPLSRLNDGVCDCCDGADEPESKTNCEDICDQVLAADRAARAKAEKDYQLGSVRRKEELAAFEALAKETMAEIEKVDQEIKAKDTELQRVRKQMEEAKLAYMDQRRGELLTVVNAVVSASDSDADERGLSGLLQPLTNDELSLLIQLTCQLSGEMEGSMKERTCVPLRLAGVDLGLLWSDEAFKNATVDLINNDDEEGRQLLAELVNKNQKGEKVWSEKKANEDKPKDRRRLDDYHPDDDDDDYHHEYEEEDYEEQEDDDNREAYERYKRERDDQAQEDTEEQDDSEEEDEEEQGDQVNSVKAIVEGTLFSRPRKNFLAHSQTVVAKIEEFVKAKKDEAKQKKEEQKQQKEEEEKQPDEEEKQKDKKEDESEAIEEDSVNEEPSFDPIAYNMAKSTLKRRQQAIRRGLQYAVSGHILVDAISRNSDAAKARADLINLAAATLMHSRASAEHVWRMLSTVLPELVSTYADDAQTCASPLASICPAKAISRSGRQYPPAEIMKAGEAACERAVDEINAAGCSDEASEEIIIHVPDGYYGYNDIQPRGDDDPLHQVFLPLYSLFPTSVNEFENTQRSLEDETSTLEKNVKLLDDKIGGRDQHDNIKRELHGLKDSCHLVTEGKYDYEVCIYGKATQKDKGAKSGTNLGNWVGMTVDEESGDRVMKWERGQKCWNGPQRSATVIVKCGAETKVLSAEEPDTCSYLLEMESYIACDDDYYQKHLA